MIMKSKTFRYFFLIPIFLIISVISCNKRENPVPITSVNVTIFDIESDPLYTELRVSGNSALLIKPSECLGYHCNGIIIFRYKTEGNVDDFRAFDVTCTKEADSCAMEIDHAFADLLTCPCCGSVFTMQDGYMIQGPAKYPLREYQCDFMNGDLRIY